VPDQGLPIARLLEEKGLLVTPEQVNANLKATAQSFDLPFGEGKMIYNSRLAQEIGLWAQNCGKAHQFHDAAFKAYFVDDRNLADKSVILDLAASAGLDVAEAEDIIDSRSYADAVDRDWAKARELELVAAPTFLMKDQRLVGAKPYQILEKMVAQVVGEVQN
jgi:predicted DsbA family dithiol-disulfide isomerase